MYSVHAKYTGPDHGMPCFTKVALSARPLFLWIVSVSASKFTSNVIRSPDLNDLPLISSRLGKTILVRPPLLSSSTPIALLPSLFKPSVQLV